MKKYPFPHLQPFGISPKLCVYMWPLLFLSTSTLEIFCRVHSQNGQKITKFSWAEKISTFNECLFSHLKCSRTPNCLIELKQLLDPSTAIESVYQKGFSKCEYRGKKAVSPLNFSFPQKPPDYPGHFPKAFHPKILKFPLLYSFFISIQGEREAKNPLLNLKRHFEYVSSGTGEPK